ncbi:hypothetical protein [Klebsiella pneumoniae]
MGPGAVKALSAPAFPAGSRSAQTIDRLLGADRVRLLRDDLARPHPRRRMGRPSSSSSALPPANGGDITVSSPWLERWRLH